MNTIKESIFPFIITIFYSVILVNLSIVILVLANLLNFSYNASITLVALFFILELIFFFSNKTSLGILILSLILAIPYYIINNNKLDEVQNQIKKYLFVKSCNKF
jgi:hypothetical protein